MKKLLFFGFLSLLISCDDGDLQIETIDFDSVSIQDCSDIDVGKINVLFKINESEALILTLPNGLLKNEISETVISSKVPNASKISYRIFSDKVAANYFCDEIPLTSPTVLEEIEAEGGSILITTTTTDSITFTHEIRLSEISFITSTNTRITNLNINDFGSVTTKIK